MGKTTNAIKFGLYLALSLLLLQVLFPLAIQAAQTVRITRPQSSEDASFSYFAQLLQNALDKTTLQHGKALVIQSAFVMEQGRAEKNLAESEYIDVHWMGTSRKREQTLKAIRIPLLKGLLGYRGMIIRQADQALFMSIKDWGELKKYPLCQGMHWPDSDILQQAGFKVVRVVRYEAMFAMLENQRCRFFPRGVHEGPSEAQARNGAKDDIAWFDKRLIYYPFPMYFFTSRNNIALAKRIEEGLNIMIETGEFDAYMAQHLVTRHLFPFSQWAKRVAIQLPNPELPDDTNITDKKYWLVPE
ncbi:hypothetical protein SAMN02745127_02218 [Oceanospirillum multiglobuliferum]|uniref:Solute-binding protein family 3/N-terminal domain-containing protein n=1 Tax=Oceanospirillum multiglobuliferum TaxID=64969 RepID=A0A1T4R7S5_9GAMM|nr:hypothetical protein [Oceanospirillum multiglobuliferum]OPX55201.1 hypothetical protein BTE48_09645 [Oceanospirillum multiglobuliferum]SKA11738.1 hypothetical protein SAMN02745127_02218 [Oceanospirillum multiglobuliferum]